MSLNRIASSTSQIKTSHSDTSRNEQKKEAKKIRSSRTALFELLEGVALYVFCITMPAFFGIVVKYYDEIIHHYPSSWVTYYYDYLVSSLVSSFCKNQTTPCSGGQYLYSAICGGCTSIHTTTNQTRNYWTDLQLVFLLSVGLALLRVLIFHLLVPDYLASPQKFKAIMRCKSSHALSSDSLQNFANNNKIIQNKRLGRKITSASNASLFSGPRYATSLFKFLYLFGTTTFAWLAFHSAEFWPIYLGGLRGGRTRSCWNLSGNVNYSKFDSDFDSKNDLLRYYFIIQASYHLQSICFQILASLGWFVLAKREDKSNGSMRSSFTNYIRPFLEHLFATVIIGSAFLFSGLRRLGAVGMYTMDLSGLFLQGFEICLHAPFLSNRKICRKVHSFVVVPAYLYCRMFVFPFIVIYSVLFESKEWFDQLGHILPMSGTDILYRSFCVLLLSVQLLNVIYLRRLLHHPQVISDL